MGDRVQKQDDRRLYKGLFYSSVLIVGFVCLLIILLPDQSANLMGKINKFLTGEMGWYYLVSVFATTMILIFLSVSKYGDIRLGGEDAKPEYSTKAWIGMIVSCGTGSSLLYYGTIEWAFYYNTPVTPWSVLPGTWEAGEISFAYSLFHEGVTAWALYAVCAMVIGYFYHNKKLPFLRLSSICGPILGDKIDKWPGKLIDILFIFGVIGGVATSLGISTRTIAVLMSEVLNLESGFFVEAIVMLLRAVFIVTALALGLDKGIKKVADLNMIILYGMLAIILFAGPTFFIINNFTSAIGLNLKNFFSWSLWTDAIGKTNFPQDWTIFYWAWWALYAPVTGLFLAKISKGRSFKEIALGVVGGGTIAIWVMYAVMTGYAQNLEFTGAVAVSEIANTLSPELAVAEVLNTLPGKTIMILLYSLAMFVYSMGTLNSFSYTLASATTVKLRPDQEPHRANRVFWAAFLNALAIALMYLGGSDVLKIASVITAFPIFIVMFLMIASFFKSVKADGVFKKNVVEIPEEYSFYQPEDSKLG